MSPADVPVEVIGLAELGRMVFEGRDAQPLFTQLLDRVQADPMDAGAMMDIATLLLATGQTEAGLRIQADALVWNRLYRRPGGDGALKLLVLVAPGDLMANTPVDFLLEGADVELISCFVVPGEAPPTIPPHDAAFLAIGESEANRPALAEAEAMLKTWPKPVLNRSAAAIAALTRDGVSHLLANSTEILAPAAKRVTREAMQALADGDCDAAPFPLLARPIASHAGTGLAKLNDAADAMDYLTMQGEADFYLTPFVDYAGADGLYRKQRIVLIKGRPFICHMAISEHWMVHYMNAGMTESAGKRAEEAAFMQAFDADFAARHAGAFASLHERIGLDYFGFDCAETRDGRLLLFEADVAMIVHDMDPPDPFAYKKPVMRKLMAAFVAMLREAAA